MSLKFNLKTSTMVLAVAGITGAAFAVTTATAETGANNSILPVAAARTMPAAQCNPCGGCNPCAAKKCNPCGGCNPCAAKQCNPCGGCNPCAAKKCNPCGGCNPCAAKKGCNPCAAKKCNPCAAAKCNPCGGCNPCNPCAGGGGGMMKVSMACAVPGVGQCGGCNPCAAKKGCNPCNPCAAKKCNPCGGCNPCAAKQCNPCGGCNPCAAKKNCNPCNPCAAKKCNPCGGCNPCNPCNPCAGGGGNVTVTSAQAADAYDCILGEVRTAFSGVEGAGNFTSWTNHNTVPYESATHGGRYVNNYSNETASEHYARYEEVGEMPRGSVLAKDSFTVQSDGKVAIGPLFLMEKMGPGFDDAGGNWKYTMVQADGNVFGETNGANSGAVQFCADCHAAVAGNDYLFFLPPEFRK